MANALYGKGRENFLSGDISWDGDTIKLILGDATEDTEIDVDAVIDLVTVPAEDRVDDISGAFATKTIVLGVADADDIVLTTVSGNEIISILIGVDGGDALVGNPSVTDFSIARIDTATGLPCTPNGGDITISWQVAAPKIFKL